VNDVPEIIRVEETVETLRIPPITINVEFNELLRDEGEPRTWELLGKLKDLMS
jgi:hypothetical protein